MSIDRPPEEPSRVLSAARSGEAGAHAPGRATTITEEFVEAACARLAAGRTLRRALPGWGRIHVDRQLPFLCVFRRSPREEQAGTEELLEGEASYVLAPAERRLHAGLASLVGRVIDTLLPSFGAFLLVEVWTSAEGRTRAEGAPAAPRFRILRSRRPELTSTIEALEAALGRIRMRGKAAEVEVVTRARATRPGLKPLLPRDEHAERRVYALGLELPEVHVDAKTGDSLPLVRREFRHGLSRALKRTFFEFTRSQTTDRPPHFQSLGRRSVVKAVWQVDEALAELSNAFDLLLLVTPTNADAAWRAFRRKGFERAPAFSYRPCAIDPSLLKRQLWKIPVERIEDPTLEDLFRRQQMDLDRRLSMLGDRLTPNFAPGSVQLFGRPDAALIRLARRVLGRVPPRTRDEGSGRSLGAREFAARAEREIALYRELYPELKSRVELRSDYTGLVVSRGNLLVGASMRIPQRRVEALISHEVGTHVVTYANGRAQPFRQLYVGLPGYEELQEGLAVLSEYLVGGLSRERLRLLAARVVAVERMLEGASFAEVFRELHSDLFLAQRAAFSVTLRVFRGGGLTKDMVYLRGLDRLLSYLGEGKSIEPLLIGKLGAEHVGLIEELRWRKVLRDVPLRPRYFDLPKARRRLDEIRQGSSVLDLIDGGDK